MENNKPYSEVTHFPFYRSYLEAISTLEDNERLSLYDGIAMYAFYGISYQPISPATRMAFTLI